jgi:hypothetical protein
LTEVLSWSAAVRWAGLLLRADQRGADVRGSEQDADMGTDGSAAPSPCWVAISSLLA